MVETAHHSPVNTVLIDFDAVVDYKIGIIKVLHKYRDIVQNVDTEYISSSYLDLIIDHVFDYDDLIYKALDKNPNYETLTEQFLESDYEKEIYLLSPLTAISKMINIFINSGSVDTTILCKNDLQKEIIGMKFKCKTIIGSRKEINLDRYGRIIVGYTKDLEDFNDPELKDFLVLNFRENMEKDSDVILTVKYIMPLLDTNRVSVVDSYTLPDGLYPEG